MAQTNTNQVAQELEQLRERLLTRREELSRSVRQEMLELDEAAEHHHLADADELGGDAQDEDTPYTLLELEGNELQQIDHALERMDDGTYGMCEDCEEAIAPARLQALPLATTCIECKRAEERAEMAMEQLGL